MQQHACELEKLSTVSWRSKEDHSELERQGGSSHRHSAVSLPNSIHRHTHQWDNKCRSRKILGIQEENI
jgi:hypothetical protein